MEGSPWGRMGQHYESNGDAGSKSAREGLIKGNVPVWENGNVGKGKYGRRVGRRRRIVWWERGRRVEMGRMEGGFFLGGLEGENRKLS